MTAKIINIKDAPTKYKPVSEEIYAAFKEVFPEEHLVSIEIDDKERTILAITSQEKVRRYLRQPGQSFLDLFKTTKHVGDASKRAKND